MHTEVGGQWHHGVPVPLHDMRRARLGRSGPDGHDIASCQPDIGQRIQTLYRVDQPDIGDLRIADVARVGHQRAA
ncbi:MAG: hypothetical protein EOO27_11875 [Comamonadaceae bacterium]|nr:MAG: hypothetical protein EOO27_11875 [Comamonadaceae bacterium]